METIDPFIFRLAIFILSIFVGYYVVWSVTPALHTPLMSVTNAISSVIIVGALIAVAVSSSDSQISFYVELCSFISSCKYLWWISGHHEDVAMYKKGKKNKCYQINIIAILYLISGIFLFLALRGLSSPETSRTGNIFGMTGMTIAIVTTLFSVSSIEILLHNIEFIAIPLLIGAIIGGFVAARIAMTAMPQLVAGFHSLVGLCCCFNCIAAFYNPSSIWNRSVWKY